MSGAERQSHVERKTKETEVAVQLNIDGTGSSKIQTPIPFFSHMLEAWSKHGLMDLTVDAQGDVEVDQHHTVEDLGIAQMRRGIGGGLIVTRPDPSAVMGAVVVYLVQPPRAKAALAAADPRGLSVRF